MSKIDQYIHAATRENTRISYQSAIRHFEETWEGFLPATADSVTRYLANYADTLTISTLKLRLAALSQWHIDQGFPDPTKASMVKKVLKGIKELHPAQVKQAKPLKIDQLEQLAIWMDERIEKAKAAADHKMLLTQTRNKALVLIGFWRGFRSDELSRLQAEHIQLVPGEGMTIFLPRSKGDRQNLGQEFKVPALSRLCPINAYQEWILLTGMRVGPVFFGINRWGQISDRALNPNSIIMLLKGLFRDAGLPDADSFSSHSLRRGFASWASDHQWDIKLLMEYVGWRDIKSAMRYIDTSDNLVKNRIERALE